MKKNYLIIIAVVIILVIAGTVYLKSGLSRSGEEVTEETLSLSGTVLSVDVENKFLVVKSTEGQEFKVIISESTKLIGLEASFDSQNPPEPGTQFVPKQNDVQIADFNAGDEIFIKTKENIAGKAEFDSVDFIQILP